MLSFFFFLDDDSDRSSAPNDTPLPFLLPQRYELHLALLQPVFPSFFFHSNVSPTAASIIHLTALSLFFLHWTSEPETHPGREYPPFFHFIR